MNMINMGSPFEMKKFECGKRAFQNVTFQNIMKFANFKNGDTAILWGPLHAMRTKAFTARSRRRICLFGDVNRMFNLYPLGT